MAPFCTKLFRNKTRSFRSVIVIISLISYQFVSSESNDIQSYLDALNTGGLVDINHIDGWKKSQSDQDSMEEDSMESWGIPDLTAIAGRLFKYKMPKDLLGNDDSPIKVLDITSGELPDWMTFDELSNELLGVPTLKHIGKQHYLEVVSTATNLNPYNYNRSTMPQPTKSKDMFSVSVLEDKVHLDSKPQPFITSKINVVDSSDKNEVERIKCPSGSSVTKATIIVDVNMKDLLPKEMVEMIENLGKHLNMPAELLRMVPVGNKPIMDSAALVAGLGDSKNLKSSGTFLQWEVGCGNVHGYHMPILEKVETSAGDGTMSKSLDKGVVGWHVTNNRPPTLHRLKRRVSINPTPVPGHKPPSRADSYDEEGSGFWNENSVIDSKPKSSPTAPVRPTKTRKPHRNKTRKPRPNKTTGRHHNRTKHPKHTVTARTSTPVITPTKSTTPVMSTSTEQYHHQPTPALTLSPRVSTTTTTVATPPLPDIITTPLAVTSKPIEPTKEMQNTKTSTKKIPYIPTESFNFKPKNDQKMKNIEIRVGDVLEYKVPKRTFFDEEDGNTRNLQLSILTVDSYNLPNNSWVQFDEKTQTIYGIPMKIHIGTYTYRLMALDKHYKMGSDVFEIKVNRRPPVGTVNHEFSMKLNLNYDRFVEDVSQRFDVTRKLANVYGDKDMSKITVTKISKGSVEYIWTNNSLPLDSCPVSEINKLLSYLLVNDELNENFTKAMAPYEVLGAGVSPKGSCDTEPFAITKEPTVSETTVIKVKDDQVESRATSDDDQFITTIVPVVVITTMLLIAAIIVCCLYRRKRKGKMSDEDNSTFVSKGIPVIFADELEDKPDPPTKPLIMSEEKPPLPPPEYPRSNSGGSMPSTPGSGHKEPLLEDERYTRPPPVTSGTGSGRRLPKTPNQPQYRQPPPYTTIAP